MAKEKYIKGKHDDAAHDGRYSNTKRLLQAIEDQEYAEQLPQQEIIEMKPGTIYPLDKVGKKK